jgi:pimeloyl-ACP methyl ester carboxylesterase
VVGVSYSDAVALQLAADSPTCVHSLTLLEPPPVHVPSAAQFLVANAQLLENYHAHGPVVGLDRFLTRVIGPDWRAAIERAVPGAADQMERDIGTFFDTDLPARQAGCWTRPELLVCGGAPRRNRTGDPILTMDVLCRLS